MEVFEGLLRIKRVREESREVELHRAKQHLEMAVQALAQARESQHQRDRERADRERALYEDVFKRTVFVSELDDLKLEIDAMKTAAKADAQAVTDAQEQRQKRHETFDDRLKAWRVAAQAARKYEDLAAEELRIRANEAEWFVELELEEHPARNLLSAAMDEDAQEV
jgi:type III secretion protein O